LYPLTLPIRLVIIARLVVMERWAPHRREKKRMRGSTPASKKKRVNQMRILRSRPFSFMLYDNGGGTSEKLFCSPSVRSEPLWAETIVTDGRSFFVELPVSWVVVCAMGGGCGSTGDGARASDMGWDVREWGVVTVVKV
jgi:hypothetical protein